MKKIEDANLVTLYIFLLFRELVNINEWPSGLLYYDEIDIYRAINKYYLLDKEISLNVNSKEDRKKLFDYARNKTRYEVFGEYIKKEIRNISCDDDTVDLFVLKNINQLYDEIYDEVRMYEEQFIDVDVELSKLSKEEIINIVKHILIDIDPTGEWLEIYDDIIKNNKIIYINEMSEEEKDNFRKKYGLDKISATNYAFIRVDDDRFLSLNYNGNTKDVVDTIHEIIHYIMDNNGNTDISFLFSEFLSIFYEIYAIDYLLKNGYSKEEGLMLMKSRMEDVANKSRDTFLIRQCALSQIKHGKIDKNIFLDCLRETVLNVGVTINDSTILYTDNIQDYCNDVCDIMLGRLVVDPGILNYTGRYVIGTYLALWARESAKYDKNILNILKGYVSNIKDMNPYAIFSEMGVPVDEMGFSNFEMNYRRKIKKK